MENKELKTALLVIFWICFWPIALPIWAAARVSDFDKSLTGAIGEAFVSRKLHELPEASYSILNNILLPSSGNTPTTQIDHIVVSIYGIFCIETKSHSGWIYGSAQSKYWKQVKYANRYPLYNPLWQNYAHIKALERVLSLHMRQPIVSLIAFPSAERIRVRGTDKVGRTYEVINKIKSYLEPIYTAEECEGIVWLIKNANITDKGAAKQHKADVREMVKI